MNTPDRQYRFDTGAGAAPAAGPADQRPDAAQRVRAETLFGGSRELIIEHASGDYRLRQTSKGKLILTK